MRNAEDEITAWYWLLTDIDDRKRAEQKLQKNEEDLRTILDAIRQGRGASRRRDDTVCEPGAP